MVLHMMTTREPEWTFGDRVRKARRLAGLNSREFADALGITSAALSQYETDRSYPRDAEDIAGRVSRIAGVPAAWVLGTERRGPALGRRRPARYRSTVPFTIYRRTSA